MMHPWLVNNPDGIDWPETDDDFNAEFAARIMTVCSTSALKNIIAAAVEQAAQQQEVEAA